MARYIDIQCAYEGAPLLPPEAPGPEPMRPVIEPDTDFYEINGLNYGLHPLRVQLECCRPSPPRDLSSQIG